jgi:hypothetical protein
MRRDRTFARILLIFSITNVALAAPAVIRQRSLVTDTPDNESTGESMPSLETASGVSETSAGPGSTLQGPPESQSGSMHVSPLGSQQDWTPGSSPVGSLHQNGVEPATPHPPPAGLHQDWAASHASLSDVSLSPQVHDGPPSGSGSPQLSDPRPGSGTSQLHDGAPAGLGAQPDVSKNVPLRGDTPSGSGAQPLFKDAPWWQNYRPVSEISPEIEHEPPTYLVEDSRKWPSFGPGWGETYTATADAYAKEVKDKAKLPKGFCGLRCWKPFRRSLE